MSISLVALPPARLRPSGRRLRASAAAVLLLFAGCTRLMESSRHLSRAQTFYAQGHLERAELEYLNVLHLEPNNAEAAERLGRISFDRGHYGRALPYLLHAKELRPDSTEVRRMLARLSLAFGSDLNASREALFLLQQDSRDGEALIFLAEAARTEEAIAEAKKQIQGFPKDAPEAWVARGIVSLREGDTFAAEAHFLEALTLLPGSPFAYAGLGSVYERRNEIARARKAYQQAAEASPPTSTHRLRYAQFLLQAGENAEGTRLLEAMLKDAPQYVPAMVRLVEAAVRAGDLSRAETLLEAASAPDPLHPETMIMKARVALARGQADKALTAANRFLTQYPDSVDGYVESARAHFLLNDYEGATNDLRRALELAPDTPEATTLLASIQIRQGTRSQAILALRALLKKHPSVYQAYVLLAEAYRAEGNWRESVQIYQQLERIAPGSDQVPYMLGLILLQQNRTDSAREAFDTAYARNPRSLAALERLTALDLTEHKFDDAAARLQAARAALPASAGLEVLVAKVCLSRGQGDQGETHLRNAVRLQPDLAAAYGMLAAYYAAAGKTDRALSSLDSAVQQNPRDVAAWTLMGILHEREKHPTEARDAYESALAANPRFAPALNNLAFLYSEHFHNLDKSFELAKRARSEAPADPYVADTLGWTLYRRGEYAWALSLLKESTQKIPGSPDILFHLGMTQYRLGDETAALGSFGTAIALNMPFGSADECRQRIGILEISPKDSSPGAEQRLREHLEREPDDGVASRKLAGVLRQRGNVAEALVILQKAASTNPQNNAVSFSLAESYAAAGDIDNALQVARKLRKADSDNSEVALLLAELTFKNRNFRAAFSLFQEAARIKGNDARALRGLGRSAYSIGLVSLSLANLGKALEQATGFELRQTLQREVELIEAGSAADLPVAVVDRASAAVQADPGNVPALIILANDARARNDNSGQRKYLESALAAYPEFSPAQLQLTLLLASDPKEDKRTLQLGMKARETYRDSVPLTVALAMVAYRQGDHQKTVALIESVSPKLNDPADAEVWYCLGMSQSQLRRRAEARQSLTKALGLGLSGSEANKARQLLASID